jgi:hypothetical protein
MFGHSYKKDSDQQGQQQQGALPLESASGWHRNSLEQVTYLSPCA